jgi:hypothetical protein
MSGSEAWVFMLGGDLIVSVIGLTTLGLAYLHIEPAALGVDSFASRPVILWLGFLVLTHIS